MSTKLIYVSAKFFICNQTISNYHEAKIGEVIEDNLFINLSNTHTNLFTPT